MFNNPTLSQHSLIIGSRESQYFETKLAFLWLCSVTVFSVQLFPKPDCDQFKPFHFSWFWNRTWQILSYALFLSFHPPHVCTKHWHSKCVTQTCREERVSSQLWWGWGLAVPGVKQQWKTSFFSVSLNGLLSNFWRCGPMRPVQCEYMRVVVGGVRWGEGCHPAITDSAKYNITTVVGLCDLCVCSVRKRRKGPAPTSLLLLLLPDTQHFTFIRHLTCLSGHQGASTRGLMERAAAAYMLALDLKRLLTFLLAFLFF